MKLTKRLFLALAASTTIATLPIAAFADGWTPKRPIDFTIMAGAGGTDAQVDAGSSTFTRVVKNIH